LGKRTRSYFFILPFLLHMGSMKETLAIIFINILRAITFPIRFAFPAKLKIERYEIGALNLPTELEGLRIVQISDIHWDHQPIRMTKQLFEQVTDAVNSLDPHLLLLTGDYVNYKPEPIQFFSREFLKPLKSHYGVYAVLGNHDYKTASSGDLIKQYLQENGVKVLTNEQVFPIPNSKFIQLFGVGDLSSHEFSPEKVKK
jgi:predicted MPP superfamily phosphohydrolase